MPRKKSEDFLKYVAKILKNSMLTGIPQIATAGNWRKRIVRTLVFFLCVGGFIYQSMVFMNLYWEYEVVMDVRVESPVYAERPAITVCNKEGIKMQELCDRKEEPEVKKMLEKAEGYCHRIEKFSKNLRYCDCIPRYCTKLGQLRNLSTLNTQGLDTLPWDVKQQWLATPKDIIVFCYEMKLTNKTLNYCSDDYLRVPCRFHPGSPESCVTVNSLIGGHNSNQSNEKVVTDGYMKLVLKQNEYNYDDKSRDPLMALSIHNPYTISNPFTEGFYMESERQYTIRIKKVVKKLLPPPYKTNCMDYRSLWRARGGYGPTNFKECVQECQRNLSMEKHGCIMGDISMPTQDRRCSIYDRQDGKIYLEARPCVEENCRPACYEEYYVADVQSWSDIWVDCKPENDKRRDTSIAYIYFDGMETTTYTYSPKYENIETYSYLGGYVGMWLGISLVAVFDFVETVVAMMQYPLKRLALFREKKSKITEVRKLKETY